MKSKKTGFVKAVIAGTIVGAVITFTVFAITKVEPMVWLFLAILAFMAIIIELSIWAFKTANRVLGGWLERTFPNYMDPNEWTESATQ